jgi:hypothetical protein
LLPQLSVTHHKLTKASRSAWEEVPALMVHYCRDRINEEKLFNHEKAEPVPHIYYYTEGSDRGGRPKRSPVKKLCRRSGCSGVYYFATTRSNNPPA